MSTAIEFNNISKQYRLGLVSTRTLSHDLNRWWTMNVLRKEDPYLKIGDTNNRATKGESEYVWALKDIDFKVEQGDVLGIIGKNGAGKSTLLKILSKVTAPTTGTIKARGRIASLLEVGTGFHPEMTGRENIYMNGSIMGMTKPEITRKLDEIVDFAGVERYLDTPVKRYSSGMTVRLGFAIAAHLEPEILVVDEVLAVGDAEFQKKAIGKMQDVSKGEGRTVLFVSHNMAAVKSLCNNSIILSNGKLDYYGKTTDAISIYLNETKSSYTNYLDSLKYYSNEVFISHFTINGEQKDSFELGQKQGTLNVSIKGTVLRQMSVSIIVRIFDYQGVLLASYIPGFTKDCPTFNDEFYLDESIDIPRNVSKSQYYATFQVVESRIRVLAELNRKIIFDFDGIIGDSGHEFIYQQDGFLIL